MLALNEQLTVLLNAALPDNRPDQVRNSILRPNPPTISGLARYGRAMGCALAPALLFAAPAMAQTEHHHHDAGPAAAPDYAPKAQAASPTPFTLGVKVTRSDGMVIDLSALKGRPTIMTMFFASCPDVCPLMTENILQAESQIPADELQDLQVVMVSFDDRDTPAVLDAYRKAHGIMSPRWTIASASPAASRTLGDLLGVRFQKLPNGSYSHTAMVDLVAADGAILARVPGPSLADPEFQAAIRAMLSMSSAANP